MSDPQEIAEKLEEMREDEIVVEDVEVLDEKEVEEEIEEIEKSPPGFKSYEEYVAEGGDPDMYKGKKAFEAEYERIQEIRRDKSETKELKDGMSSIIDTLGEWKTQQTSTIRAELEAQLAEQKRTADVDGALETKEKLDALKETPKKQETPPLNPVLEKFMTENPIIDQGSDQFNDEFFSDMARLQAKKINEMSDNGGADLTDAQILKCTKAAFASAKELNAELFTSKRNSRQGQGRQARTAPSDKGQSIEVRLKNYQTSGVGSENNKDAALSFYKTLKEKNPKAAEKFALNLLGESS